MKYGAHARIILRYGIGIVLGMEIGQDLASDPDLVIVVAGVVAAAVECFWTIAKRKGWSL